MRIISGKHRGRRLADFNGDEIRPTADRVKESLFNILAPDLQGAVVLDLFCGSGGLGLECISRGAARVFFNDVSQDSLSVLKKNLSAIKEEDSAVISNLDYAAFLKSARQKFDMIFLDPPYRYEYGAEALKIIASNGLLAPGGIAVYERDRAFSGSVEGLKLYDERKYGKTYLSFFRIEEKGEK